MNIIFINIRLNPHLFRMKMFVVTIYFLWGCHLPNQFIDKNVLKDSACRYIKVILNIFGEINARVLQKGAIKIIKLGLIHF